MSFLDVANSRKWTKMKKYRIFFSFFGFVLGTVTCCFGRKLQRFTRCSKTDRDWVSSVSDNNGVKGLIMGLPHFVTNHVITVI